jgi:catechol 2,3-dioxygenase
VSTGMTTTPVTIDARTRVGAVHVTVADLERSIRFYERSIGLAVLETDGPRALLGAGGEGLVALVEEPGARPVPGSTGLFHMALRVPDRADLARWLVHAARTGIPLSGMSDHFVSEAIYLQDPDDHGIEVYRDRPRSHWEGQVARMTTEALSIGSLLGELEDPGNAPFDGLPAGTDMGHIHLRVSDVEQAVAFYAGILGFDLMTRYGGQAAFLAAGGYHHHVGANTWMSLGGSAAPEGSAALRHATILLPDAAERDRVAGRVADAGQEPMPAEGGVLVRDPAGNRLLLAAA